MRETGPRGSSHLREPGKSVLVHREAEKESEWAEPGRNGEEVIGEKRTGRAGLGGLD